MRTDWVITIPKTISWCQYQLELAKVVDHREEMRFRCPPHFKAARFGDRCFIVHDGMVRGWMTITGLEMYRDHWQCTTTGKWWEPGTYIKRAGKFYPVDGPQMRGFQGIRRYEGK